MNDYPQEVCDFIAFLVPQIKKTPLFGRQEAGYLSQIAEGKGTSQTKRAALIIAHILYELNGLLFENWTEFAQEAICENGKVIASAQILWFDLMVAPNKNIALVMSIKDCNSKEHLVWGDAEKELSLDQSGLDNILIGAINLSWNHKIIKRVKHC